MEKDYFQDRSPDAVYYDAIHVGDLVFICEKQAQKYAKTIEDLTLIQVTKHLTSQKLHPRGQKVQGTDYNSGEEKIGRVVYLLKDGKVVTKDGEKYIYEMEANPFPSRK